jgi:hypothetical protein
MWGQIKKFPWFEVALIIGLAIALIVRPGNGDVPKGAPNNESGVTSFLPSLNASTQPRASL